jgi:hypothetical protein
MNRRGQILPLFAIVLVGIVAAMALAIDVTSAYSARQSYRTIADTAALAGAQDLTRTLDYVAARNDAEASLMKQLGVALTCTASSANPVTCTAAGTAFAIKIRTPLASDADCVSCDSERSVLVNFANPQFGVSFTRIFGIDHWNVASAAVAGREYGSTYALMTLRPPAAATIPGVRDINLAGNNTHVVITTGDVGTNANMVYSGAGAMLFLDPGYSMRYFDPILPPQWSSPPDPIGKKLNALILDPNYFGVSGPGSPSSSGSPATYANKAAALDATGGLPSATCMSIVTTYIANPLSGPPTGYDITVGSGANAQPVVPRDGLGAIDWTAINCYKQGVYNFKLQDNNKELTVLEPGLYFFNQGITVQSSLIGGYQASSPGVALVFPATELFKNRNGLIALNGGSKLAAGGSEATPAFDYAGNLVQTNTTPPLVITLIVQRDSRCTPVYPFPSSCANVVENANKAIDLSGGSALYLAGVQYGPSDNMSFSGGSSGNGYVGQIVAWTVTYTGQATLNQEGVPALAANVLRLDGACTVVGVVCNP